MNEVVITELVCTLIERVGLLCFVLIFGWELFSSIVCYIQEKAHIRRYYSNIKQILTRFEMQGILGIDITYHHTQFYIAYLDNEICADDLLSGLMQLQELLYSNNLYQPSKWFIKRLKRKNFWKRIKAKLCR